MFFEWLGFYVSISVLLAVEVGESTTGNSAVILMQTECRIVKSIFCVVFFRGLPKFFLFSHPPPLKLRRGYAKGFQVSERDSFWRRAKMQVGQCGIVKHSHESAAIELIPSSLHGDTTGVAVKHHRE